MLDGSQTIVGRHELRHSDVLTDTPGCGWGVGGVAITVVFLRMTMGLPPLNETLVCLMVQTLPRNDFGVL